MIGCRRAGGGRREKGEREGEGRGREKGEKGEGEGRKGVGRREEKGRDKGDKWEGKGRKRPPAVPTSMHARCFAPINISSITKNANVMIEWSELLTSSNHFVSYCCRGAGSNPIRTTHQKVKFCLRFSKSFDFSSTFMVSSAWNKRNDFEGP